MDGLTGAFSPAAKIITPLPTPVITGIQGGKERLTINMNTLVFDDYSNVINDPYYDPSLPILSNNVWYDDIVWLWNSVNEYQFYAVTGMNYDIQWNDSWWGDWTKGGVVEVRAYWKDSGSTIFSYTTSGFSSPRNFTAFNTGIVVVQVRTYAQSSSYTGTYGLRYYTTSGSFISDEYILNVDAYDIYLSQFSWDTPWENTIPTTTITGNTGAITSATINGLNPNQTYHVWVRGKNNNNGEWVHSEWTSRSEHRVPNSAALMSNLNLNWQSGTVLGNTINFNISYNANISSLNTSFSLSSGATASINNSQIFSGNSYNFSSQRIITVTAEDGETQTQYTVNVNINTPIQISFTGPVDEDFDVTMSGNAHFIEREVTIVMWDSRSDGWDGNGALRININGSNLPVNARLFSGAGPGYYTFTVFPNDEVNFYWVNGNSYDYENAFVIYYTDSPPSPAFNPSTSLWSPANDPEGRVLVYRQFRSSGQIFSGTHMGSFTVESNNLTTADTLELFAPSGYAGYKWIINNIDMGTNDSLVLEGSDLFIGPNSITLVVYKNEGSFLVPYSKTININVIP